MKAAWLQEFPDLLFLQDIDAETEGSLRVHRFRKRGKNLDLAIQESVIRLSDDRLLGRVGFVLDVTEQLLAEAATLRWGALRVKLEPDDVQFVRCTKVRVTRAHKLWSKLPLREPPVVTATRLKGGSESRWSRLGCSAASRPTLSSQWTWPVSVATIW